uniref:Major capsid protein N-terminal domain-containing protein n=1 Tax=viral metagenome TaxID=1070528 RepID=A0A6C0F589_9ZZZZ|tara:strand:+ start:13593 stop:15197 length:1605 start_codon:yes stop_codon:yes gene_type:complete
MGGGLLQLIAYGSQDVYLTGNPQITFFKVVYRRHTNFSMECIKQDINGHSEIGITTVNNKATVTISKTGDLLTSIYVKADQNTTNMGICGDHIIEDVEIEIGGQRIDKQYREWNQIWTELTIPKSKQEGFKYLSGSFNNNNLPQTTQKTIMYPLNFWFCRNPGLALPLIALQYHEVQLKITWGNSVYSSSENENLTRENASAQTSNTIEVWGDYVYLDTDERRRFAQVSHEYLIEQVQIQKEKDDNKKVFKLNLEHPVKEIIWTNPNSYPMTTQKAKIQINGHDRMAEQSKEYFQIKQPYQHHTSIPGYNIKEKETPELLNVHVVSGPYQLQTLKTNPISNTLNANNTCAICGLSSLTTNADYIASDKTLVIREEREDSINYYPGDIVQIRINDNDSTNTITTSQTFTITKVRIRGTELDPDRYSELTLDRNILTNSKPDGTSLTIADGDDVLLTIIARTHNPLSNCSQLKKDINIYSFSIEPEEHQPSGTCNFSKVESASLIFSDTTYVSNIYAVNYNVLRVMSGMAGIAYAA